MFAAVGSKSTFTAWLHNFILHGSHGKRFGFPEGELDPVHRGKDFSVWNIMFYSDWEMIKLFGHRNSQYVGGNSVISKYII